MSNETLTIKEKYSPYWPIISAASAVASVALYGIYLSSTDVLLEGYLRLSAFVFFALFILSLFKLRDGQVEMIVEPDTEQKHQYLISYSVRGRTVHQEIIDMDSIEDFRVSEMPNRSLTNDLFRNDYTVQFKKKKMDQYFYLADIHGRVLPLSASNAEAVQQYFISRLPSA
ncbi:MAG: hypothetical protein ACNA78_00170 [Balneolaceae bacterium]